MPARLPGHEPISIRKLWIRFSFTAAIRSTARSKSAARKTPRCPILAATLLTKEPCVIHHVPDLSDIHYMLQILSHLGAQVERASGVVTVQAEKISHRGALRNRAEDARVGLRARSAARVAKKKRPSRCPAAASSATARSTCISKASRRSALRYRIDAGNVKVFAGRTQGRRR